MKPLLRFLYIIFYTIASILYLIVYFFEVILIFPIAFFYYIFTGKDYFQQDYDEMFFVKMNHKFEKIMDKMDPDYEEHEPKIDYYDEALYKCSQNLCKVKENYNTLYEYDVYYMHDNQSYVFKVTALDEDNARDKTSRALHIYEDLLIYDVVKV
jgi:hypothetical protein